MKKIIILFTLTFLLTSCNMFGSQKQEEKITHTTTTEQENSEKNTEKQNEEKLETNSDEKPDFSKNSVFTSLNIQQQGSDFTLSGDVKEDIERVEVIWSNGDSTDSYFLKKFKKGGTTWKTNTKQQYGNFALGENTYTVKGYVGEEVKEEITFSVPLEECIINFKTTEGEIYAMNFGEVKNCNNGKLNVNSMQGPSSYIEQGKEIPEHVIKRFGGKQELGMLEIYPLFFFGENIVVDGYKISVSQGGIQLWVNSLLEKGPVVKLDGVNLHTGLFEFGEENVYIFEIGQLSGEISGITDKSSNTKEKYKKYYSVIKDIKVFNKTPGTIKENTTSFIENFSKTEDETETVETKKEQDRVETPVNNSELDISEATLLKAGYKKNTLGNITEYYANFMLDKNNGYHRNQTIYKQGDKNLNFGIIYAHGPALEIELPGKNVTIHLDDLDWLDTDDLYKQNFGYNIGQPILGDYDYKVIITDLDTIKVVNKAKGINKVLWKR